MLFPPQVYCSHCIVAWNRRRIMLMVDSVRHTAFKAIVLVNSVIFVMFLGGMFLLLEQSSGDWQGLGLVGFAYMILGFFALTFYYYYEYLIGTRRTPEHPFPRLVFLLNILAPLMLLIFLVSNIRQQ